MKRFMFSLAAATAALILGCQNPDANNPVASDNHVPDGTIAKPVLTPDQNLITFDQKIASRSPGSANDVKQATGSATFLISQVPVVPISGSGLFDIRITVEGKISKAPSDLPAPTLAPWSFSGSIKERISIPQGKKVVFVKAFSVQGPSVPTLLSIPFTVTESALAVGTMSLINVSQSTIVQ